MMKMRTRRALMIAGTVVAATVALTGCSALDDLLGNGPADANRDSETGQVTESANIDVFSLKVGDCKMTSATGEIKAVDVVPCSEPHDEEVFYEFKMDDGNFSEADIEAAVQKCVGDAYTTFVGATREEFPLDIYPITPTKATWEKLDDRVVQCVLSDPNDPTTGSLKGIATR